MKSITWSGRSHDYTNNEIKFLSKVIKSSDPLTGGKYLKLFEKSLSKYLKCKNIFAVSSAAAALEIISVLCKFKPGDEVIIPAHTYCASAISFARNGAKIVWADIDIRTRVLSEEDVIKKITKKTKAIVVVHLYGFAFDIQKLKKKIRKNILIIEDCAQAFGAEIRNKKVGTSGDFSCFSFHAQKNLTTLGEGGAIYVKKKSYAKCVPGLRHNGHTPYKNQKKFYWKPAMGNVDLDINFKWPYKFTMTEIQAAAGFLVLKRIDKLNSLRIQRAKKFINEMRNFKFLEFHQSFKNFRHVYHLLVCRILDKNIKRDDLIYDLYYNQRVQCVVQYYPLYKYPLFKKMGVKKRTCPNTENFFNNMISFPFHTWMSNKDFDRMIVKVKNTLKRLNDSSKKKNYK